MHFISDQKIQLRDIASVLDAKTPIKLSKEAEAKIQKCRSYLDEKLKTSTSPIYGINTGFGSLYNRNISADQLEKLQENLVKS
ncbi:MAG TPA: aromatic amino acid lyase, partial [Chryseosolibacter sp.]|nr:aromatic amino acid lyase [Chryseosolibacter sp.]